MVKGFKSTAQLRRELAKEKALDEAKKEIKTIGVKRKQLKKETKRLSRRRRFAKTFAVASAIGKGAKVTGRVVSTELERQRKLGLVAQKRARGVKRKAKKKVKKAVKKITKRSTIPKRISSPTFSTFDAANIIR